MANRGKRKGRRGRHANEARNNALGQILSGDVDAAAEWVLKLSEEKAAKFWRVLEDRHPEHLSVTRKLVEFKRKEARGYE